jgi:hypothetical protein
VTSLGIVFRAASWLRGARVFHPRGLAATAVWDPPEMPTVPGSILGVEHRGAIIRLSHAVGFRASRPDVIGLAVRLPDAYGPGRHQDLLLASSGTGRIGRHLLRPARDLATTTFSTLLPYAIAGHGRHPIVAHAVAGSAPATYATVIGRGPVEIPAFTLRIGTVDGPVLATIHATGAIAHESAEPLAFDPWNTGPELRPVGWPNRLRRPTYAASWRGRMARTASRPGRRPSGSTGRPR